MTDRQLRWFNTKLWPDACRAQRWSPSDREHKLYVIGEILGREIKTTKDIGWGAEFDKVKSELELLANPDSFDTAMLAVDEHAGERKRIEFSINRDFPVSYWQKISWDRWRVQDLAELTIEQLRDLRRTLSQRKRSAVGRAGSARRTDDSDGGVGHTALPTASENP
jgi:hypothetical protein